jgi:hypothetical protein
VARKQGATELTSAVTEAAIAEQAEHIRGKKGFIIDMVPGSHCPSVPCSARMRAWHHTLTSNTGVSVCVSLTLACGVWAVSLPTGQCRMAWCTTRTS